MKRQSKSVSIKKHCGLLVATPLAGISVALSASVLHAAAATTATWTGGGADTNWSTGLNWNPTVPGVADGGFTTTDTSTAVFTGTAATLTPNLDMSYNLQNISFAAAVDSAYTVTASSGSQLLLSSGGTITNANTQTAGLVNETVSAPVLIENASSTSSGVYAFVSNGVGTSSTANNFLIINGNVSGSAASGGTSTLTLRGSNTTRGLITSNLINGAISDSASGGNLAVNLAYDNNGSTTWALNGANSYTGGTVLTSSKYTGGLEVGNSAALGTGTLTVSGITGPSLSATATGVNLANNIATTVGNLNLSTNGYAQLTFGGMISGTSSLTKMNTAGTLTLAGSNTYIGNTADTGGTLQLGSATALGGSLTTTTFNTTSGTPTATASSATGLAIGQLVTGTGIAVNTFISAVTGTTVTLTRNATATNAAAAVALTGTTAVSSGATLDLNGQSSSATILTLASTGVGTNGALVNTSTTTASIAQIGGQATGNPGSFTVGGVNDQGAIALGTVTGSSAFTLTKAGSQTLTLGGTSDNSFLTGVVNAGTVVLNKSTTTGSVHALNNLTLNGGTVQFGSNTATGGTGLTTGQLNGTVIVNGGTFDFNGTSGQNGAFQNLSAAAPGGTVTNTSATSATMTLKPNSATTYTYAGTITDNSGITGTGTLNVTLAANVTGGTELFTGNNTYAGGTTVTAGTLSTGATGTFGLGNVTVGTATTGATLTLSNGASIADTATLRFGDKSAASSVINLSGANGTSETLAALFDLTTGISSSSLGLSGTYTASQLNADFGDTVFNSASGETLTIASAPEPTSLLLAAVAAVPLALGRRRRAH